MSADHTHLVVVLDASGSMEPQRDETIHAVNHFLAEQRKLPGKVTVSLIVFAYVPSYVWRDLTLTDALVLTPAKYDPRGGTALLDAMGLSIDDTGRYLRRLPEEERPGKVVVLVVTDGAENSSHGYSKAEVAKKIEHQREKYNWQFLFQGADMDTINEARSMGVAVTSTMSWEPQVFGGVMRGMVANNVAVSNYRNNVTPGAIYGTVDQGGEVFNPITPTPIKP